MKTEKIFDRIQESNLFRINGNEIVIITELSKLCDCINQDEIILDNDINSLWEIGEYTDFCLDDLIIGAFWAMTDCHEGQYSESYALLCKLGEIFTPNMSSLESENDSVKYVYEQICNSLIEKAKK